MKLFRLAVRAAVLLTTGPPLVAMAACTASTVTTLQALSGPAADVRAVPAATAQQYAVRYLRLLHDRSDSRRRFAATVTKAPAALPAPSGPGLVIKASGQSSGPLPGAGPDHDVIVSAYRAVKP